MAPTPKQQMHNWTTALKKAIAKSLNSNTMRGLGEFTVDTIVARTRYKGQGVKNGRAGMLNPVSEKYAAWRKKRARHPDAAGGRKSNLTLSGDMLDALTTTKATSKAYEVGFKDPDEEAKAKGNAQRGRPFLSLTAKEIKLLSAELNKQITKNVKKI